MKIEVKGTDDVKRLLDEIAPRHALNIQRAAVHGVAGEVRNLIRKNAPKDEGALRKGIKTKRRRMSFGRIQSDVVSEEFYWAFHERGTSKHGATPFVMPSVHEIELRLPAILKEQFVKKFEAAIRRAKRRQTKKGR
ncbi:MAG: HK97-gp10 family putative phage morphogenesis protein [Pseudomonadota bacterium]